MRVLKNYRFVLAFLLFVSALLLIETPADAATILGKAAIYTSSGIQTYPLVSGDKMAFEYEALIKVPGGTLITDKGTVLEALGEGEQIPFHVEKGNIHFRILPEKARISFKTSQGEISLPKAVAMGNSVIAGGITVTDEYTKLEVNEGSLDVLTSDGSNIESVNGDPLETTSDGSTMISAGQSIILAKKPIAEEQDNEASPVGKPEDRPPAHAGQGKPDNPPSHAPGKPDDRPPVNPPGLNN
ncbi:MAG: hypothetical protein WBD99_13345 [Thermodesulfobacteriota bacterium]